MIKHLENVEQHFDKGYLLYEGETMPSVEQIKILNYSDYLNDEMNLMASSQVAW